MENNVQIANQILSMLGSDPRLQQAIGFAGWCAVAVGCMVVVLAAILKDRPRRKRTLVRAAVEGPPEKIAHSAVYLPPPHRMNYRSNRRKI